MTFKDRLKKHPDIKLAALAAKVFPNHKTAKTYLSTLLNSDKPLDAKIENRLRKELKKLGHQLINESKQKEFIEVSPPTEK